MAEKINETILRKIMHSAGFTVIPQNAKEHVQKLIEPITKDEIFMVTDPDRILELPVEVFTKIFSYLGITQKSQITPEWLAAFYINGRAEIRFGISASKSSTVLVDSMKPSLRSSSTLGNEFKDFLLNSIHARMFSLFYDTESGATLVAADVLSVVQGPGNNEEAIATSVANLAEHYSKIGREYSLIEQTGIYFRIKDREKRLKALFNESTNRFTLLEESAKQVRREPNRIVKTGDDDPTAFFVPEYAAAGANFAEQIYKAVYPHAVAAHQRLR